jgi:hypothetical protein
MVNDSERPERPRVEPEIIPPDRGGRQFDWRGSQLSGDFSDLRTTHRVYVRQVGPFGIGLLLLAIAAVVAIFTIAVLGAVLIWIPIIAAVIVAGAVLRLLRGFGVR